MFFMSKEVKVGWGVFVFIGLLSLSSLGLSLYVFLNQNKSAYVYNAQILEKYKGVVELRAQYQEQLGSWQANMDTLTTTFKSEVMQFERDKNKMSSAQKASIENYLSKRQEELYQYKAALEKKAKEEEMKYNKTLLDQINKYTIEYGKESDYEYIFGVTEDGNILYGQDAKDITEEVLLYLNQKYEGTK